MKKEQQERKRDVLSNAIDGVMSVLAKGEKNGVIALRAFSIGARFHIEFGAALIAANKYAEAACEFEQAVALAPDNAVALGNLGDTLVTLGRVDDDIVHLKRAAMLVDISRAAAASCHDAADDHFSGPLATAPDLARTWSSLGASLYALNRLDESEAAFRHALKLDANRAEVWHG